MHEAARKVAVFSLEVARLRVKDVSADICSYLYRNQVLTT